MRLLIFTILALFLVVPYSQAATYTCGTDGVDGSCIPSGLQSLIDNANDGDTINIAQATHSWASAVTINKAVTINGYGSCSDCGSTRTPTGTWNAIIERDGVAFIINDPSDAGHIGRITGIKFYGTTKIPYGNCYVAADCGLGCGFIFYVSKPCIDIIRQACIIIRRCLWNL